jgi:HAD superfamily hydrolase (TIGR01509 family)
MVGDVRIDAILFDLDGVLVDACDWHYEALNAALVGAGHPPIGRETHLSTFNGLPTRKKLEILGISYGEAIEINRQKQKHTLDIIQSSATIMSEKIELHTYLKSLGVKIACVTNSIRETAEEMLKATGQMEYIDLLVCNEDVVRNKPYPDCYNHAIRVLGVDPMNCLCVEDSPKGIQSATASIAGHMWIVSNPTEVNRENYMKFVEQEA